jgi:hypothetical protein
LGIQSKDYCGLRIEDRGLKIALIRKLVHVILSEAKNLCGPANYEILRRLAPQNDTFCSLDAYRQNG